MPVSSAVRIQGVSKSYGPIQALKNVSFDVPSRSIFGLLGPNGAGKTTLFSIIANFLRQDTGTVTVLDIDTRRISQLRGRLTILPQDAQFQRNVPILDQLIFFRRLDGQSKAAAEKEVMTALEQVGLDSVARRRVGSLSHGMQKRLGIAQAFLGHPEVILLDEPTAGLDPANARQIRDLVKALQARATIVVSSHNLAEIQELCDHVAILHRGEVVRAAAVAEITRKGHELNFDLSRRLTDVELARVRGVRGVAQFAPNSAAPDATGNGAPTYLATLDLSAPGVDLDGTVSQLLRTLLDLGVTPRRMAEGRSLETHFLQLTGGGLVGYDPSVQRG